MDGYIARHYNQRSRKLGAILDPLADKLLLRLRHLFCSALTNEPHFGSIPLWLTGTIIGRDLLLLVGLGVIQMTVGKSRCSPRIVGKIATVLQMICIGWLLFQWDSGNCGKRGLRFGQVAAALCTGDLRVAVNLGWNEATRERIRPVQQNRSNDEDKKDEIRMAAKLELKLKEGDAAPDFSARPQTAAERFLWLSCRERT